MTFDLRDLELEELETPRFDTSCSLREREHVYIY